MKNSKKTSKTIWQDTRANSLFINDPDIGLQWDRDSKQMELCRTDKLHWTLDSEMSHCLALPCTFNKFWAFFLDLVLDYKIPAKLVHKTFLDIPEYRKIFGTWQEKQDYGDEVD